MIKGRQYLEDERKALREAADEMEKALNDLFTEEFALEVSVGDAWTVSIPQAMQQKYDVGPFGRKTIKDEEVTIHAGPAYVAPVIVRQSVDSNMISDALHYRDHGYASFNQDDVKLMEPIEKAASGKLVAYERALLAKLPEPVVLVNPTGSTIWASEHMNVVVTCSKEQRDHVEKHYAAMNPPRPVPWAPSNTRRLIHYLGAHGVYKAVEGRWYALTPNPQSTGIYQNWSVIPTATGHRVRYQTRIQYDYEVPDIPQAVRFNSISTDKYLQMSEESFLLETNIPLKIERSRKVWLGTKYLKGPIPPVNDGGEIEDDQYLWDIPLGGTYLSRRLEIAKVAVLKGKEIVPMHNMGDVPVGLQTEELVPLQFHKTQRGWSLLPISEHGHVGPQHQTGILITSNPQMTPMASCPGLFFSHVRFDAQNRILDTNEVNYFLCRTLADAESRLPLIIKCLFERDKTAIFLPRGKGPPQQWGMIQKNLDNAVRDQLSLGALIQATSVPSAVYGRFMANSPSYLLVSKNMLSLMHKLTMSSGRPHQYTYTVSSERSLCKSAPREQPFDRLVVHSADLFDPVWLAQFREGRPMKATAGLKVALVCSYQHFYLRDGFICSVQGAPRNE